MAEKAGLAALADQHLTVPTDTGARAGLKVSALVAGVMAGADSIEDVNVLRHGGMGRLFTNLSAPNSASGSATPKSPKPSSPRSHPAARNTRWPPG